MSNLLELIQDAKRFAKSPLFDEADLTKEVDSALDRNFWVRAINQSQTYHQNIVIKAAQDYFATKETISFVSGTQEYALPGNMIQLRYLEKTDCDPDKIITPITIDQRLRYTDKEGSTDDDDALDHYVYLWDNMIGIVPNMDTATGSVNVLFIRRLPDLSYGTVSGTPTTTEVRLAATPTFGRTNSDNDYYNGATLRIVSATTGSGQKSKITDYVGSTRACTVSFAVAPSTDAVYEILCDIPEQYHPAVSMYAAILARARDDNPLNEIKELHMGLVAQMMEGLQPRWSTRGDRVEYRDL